MPDTASTLIVGAMGQGYAGLSARQCMMCVLALYSAGMTAQELTTGAASMGYHAFSDRQIDECLLKAFQ